QRRAPCARTGPPRTRALPHSRRPHPRRATRLDVAPPRRPRVALLSPPPPPRPPPPLPPLRPLHPRRPHLRPPHRRPLPPRPHRPPRPTPRRRQTPFTLDRARDLVTRPLPSARDLGGVSGGIGGRASGVGVPCLGG